MRNILMAEVLLCGLAIPALAQRDNWDNLDKLKAGNKIKVMQTNLKVVEGKFVRVSDENLTLRIDQQEVVIPRDQVYRVTHTSRGRNALIGLAVGGGLGAAMAGCCVEREGNYQAAMAGALAGDAAVGAAIGALIPHTVTQFQASKPKPIAAKKD